MTAESIVRSRISGRWLCLIFCNTVENYRLEELNDGLPTFAAWVQWSVRHGIVSEAVGRGLGSWAEARPGAAEIAYGDARDLRLHLFGLLSTHAAGDVPGPDQLTFLNERMSSALGHLKLGASASRVSLSFQDELTPDRLVWPVVYSATCLLTDPQSERLRRCGGDKCTWLFIDESKNGSRRWCDMSVCGNRAKSRRHYQRARHTASP